MLLKLFDKLNELVSKMEESLLDDKHIINNYHS